MDNRLKKTILLSTLTIFLSACASKKDTPIAPVEHHEEPSPTQKIEELLPKREEDSKVILGFYKKESGSNAVSLALRHDFTLHKDKIDTSTINDTASFIEKNIEFARYNFGQNNSIYVADFSNSLMFDYNKSDVRKSDKSLLDSFAKLYSMEAFGKYLYVIGHTDSDGSETYNYGLSVRRARSVASFLISNSVNESQLSIVPAGEYIPKSSNSTDEGKQLNRRVEIISANSRTLIQSYLRQLSCPNGETCKRKIINVFDVRKTGRDTEMNIKNMHSFSSYSPDLNDLKKLNQELNDYPDSVDSRLLVIDDKNSLLEIGELRQDFLIPVDIRPLLKLTFQKRIGFKIPKEYIIED
ncbi:MULTISPECIES: OmpA family protein [Marinomonas]|uniref:OmpA family protein n=1 Tax=Marinomonas arctica TaxID=383750 RepID=A0A7H1J6Y0_9GAMM|nr:MULTISPECIES: OmpA family protein [Marinomonas]QNT06246.1 OmpA family protein [Marinomonas arctica]